MQLVVVLELWQCEMVFLCADFVCVCQGSTMGAQRRMHTACMVCAVSVIVDWCDV